MKNNFFKYTFANNIINKNIFKFLKDTFANKSSNHLKNSLFTSDSHNKQDQRYLDNKATQVLDANQGFSINSPFVNLVKKLSSFSAEKTNDKIGQYTKYSDKHSSYYANETKSIINVSKSKFSSSGGSDSDERAVTKIQRIDLANGDFHNLVTKSTIFIDKSLFIKEIFDNGSDPVLITMPRRWGKSLNLDMLKRFLEIQIDDGYVIDNTQTINYKLFFGNGSNLKPLSIASESFKEIQDDGSIKHVSASDICCTKPVIFIDFKGCKEGSNYAKVELNLKNKIIKLFEDFGWLGSSKNTYSGKITVGAKYDQLIDDIKTKNQYTESLRFLSELLYKHFDKKPWILIDEYDAAANKAYIEFDDQEAKQVSELFRSILEPALKGNKYLEKGVMTGVQYIAKSGMLSGLNNLSKHNITSTKYSKYYGVNQEEMDLLFDHFRVSNEKRSKIKDWYNGYKAKEAGLDDIVKYVDKYNIWSVVKYFNNQSDGFKSYWEESGSIDFIKPLFFHDDFKKKIEDLINGVSLYASDLIVDFSVDDFKVLKETINAGKNVTITQNGIELIFSYLFIGGYLTIDETSVTGNEYKLPNKEIRNEFARKIKSYYQEIFNIDPKKFLELTKILSNVFDKNFPNDKVKETIQNQFAPKFDELIKSIKLYDKNSESENGLFANEDLMHSLLNNIALQIVNSNFASEKWTTKPSGQKGRADIVVSKNNTGVIIEMKYNGNAADALTQAKEYVNLIEKCDVKVFLGCNITQQQEVQLSGEILYGDASECFDYPQ